MVRIFNNKSSYNYRKSCVQNKIHLSVYSGGLNLVQTTPPQRHYATESEIIKQIKVNKKNILNNSQHCTLSLI